MARNEETAKKQFGIFCEKEYFHFIKHDISKEINQEEFKNRNNFV